VGQRSRIQQEMRRPQRDLNSSPSSKAAQPSAISALADTPDDTNEHEGPPLAQGVGHGSSDSGPPLDPVEAALSEALKLAASAGQWTTVELLSRELAARRLARTAPEVATLEGERARRERR
jgi:hypothetical protein